MTCPSCGAAMGESFCPHCGEKRRHEHELSLASFFEHLVESFTHLDGKFPRTVRGLVHPGFLTAEFVRGARVQRMRPLQLFLLTNLVYFFVQPWTGFFTFTTTLAAHRVTWYGGLARRLTDEREAGSGLSHAAFTEQFDHAGAQRAKLLIIVLIPMIALVLALVERSKRRGIGVHMALATEFMTFQLIAVSMLFPVVLGGTYFVAPGLWTGVPGGALEGIVSSISALLIWSFFALALPRVYGVSRGAAIARGFVAMIGFWIALFSYRAVLFFVTLATL